MILPWRTHADLNAAAAVFVVWSSSDPIMLALASTNTLLAFVALGFAHLTGELK